MDKILLIIQREYLTRVRKKTFLLTTFLVPIFFIAMYVGVILLTKKSFENNHATVYILDEQHTVGTKLKSGKSITYVQEDRSLPRLIEDIQSEDNNTNILLIPQDFFDTKRVEILSLQKPNVQIQQEIRSQLNDILKENEYQKQGIDILKIKQIDATVQMHSKEITKDGKTRDSNTEVAMGIAMALSILVYLSLFFYGSQVMRGVIEEKGSRIVEIIISSVKPFQLMMGKIVGIGLVGLTQFLLWILLFGALATAASGLLPDLRQAAAQTENGPTTSPPVEGGSTAGVDIELLKSLGHVNYVELGLTFFVFFLGGYLIYSALFAAVGSAVDNETEASQFTLPITMPLLLTYMLSFGVLVNDPNGVISTWLSFIPLTSPIAMMVRVPFGVPTWQIVVSAVLLIAGFVATTWLAAKIYRTGILMYGKKASYHELWKWLKHKN